VFLITVIYKAPAVEGLQWRWQTAAVVCTNSEQMFGGIRSS